MFEATEPFKLGRRGLGSGKDPILVKGVYVCNALG